MLATKAERVRDTIERHTIPLQDVEFRAGAERNTVDFTGYASLFDVGYSMWGGPEKGGWEEFVDKRAFDRTLNAKPDVVLNLNHGEGGTGLPIARTTSGTLELKADKKGLLSIAPGLDLRDPDVQALQVKVERGDVDQMSFAFRTISDLWENDEERRTLLEVSLDRGDVSIVTNGAQPKTSVQLRGLDAAIAALADLDPDEAYAEVRALGRENGLNDLVAAHTLLGQLIARGEKKTEVQRMTFAQAKRLALLDT